MMDAKIAIIGLGYVGLPLAICFGEKFKTVGFDIDSDRIKDLQRSYDHTNEVESNDFTNAKHLTFSNSVSDISKCNVYIITVPTPIDKNNQPDLNFIKQASAMVGNLLKSQDLVIYESTVYPGATEEVCVPILENCSGLMFNKDFYVGYSPERINPGDKERGIRSIIKVTSGSNTFASNLVDDLYSMVINAGTFRASSIKVAEAAKVIENTQRDLNIALMNELSKIFSLLEIDTTDVLQAAATKWNFINFQPGLVGGHCIGIDPYYLTHKAQNMGYQPDVILSGRRVNDGMGSYVANQTVKKLSKQKVDILKARILILGVTFKENCPDIRNTKVVDIKNELEDFGVNVDVYDPLANSKDVKLEYDFDLIKQPVQGNYDVVMLAVGHDCFKDMSHFELRKFGKSTHLFCDLKSTFDKSNSDFRL